MNHCPVVPMLLFVSCLTGFQNPAQENLSFDVASVKLNTSDSEPSSNFPLGPGSVYTPNGGFFSAVNQPFSIYFQFAYRLDSNQLALVRAQLPEWATTDRFDIQARAKGHDTKDDMRLMMRSLLADRFKFAFHYETRQFSVYAAILSKPGTAGLQLKPHPADAVCPTSPNEEQPSAPAEKRDMFPFPCGGLFQMPASLPGRRKMGARNVPIILILNTFSNLGDLGRPVVDHTGLTGTFDFTLEWAPDLDTPKSDAPLAPRSRRP